MAHLSVSIPQMNLISAAGVALTYVGEGENGLHIIDVQDNLLAQARAVIDIPGGGVAGGVTAPPPLRAATLGAPGIPFGARGPIETGRFIPAVTQGLNTDAFEDQVRFVATERAQAIGVPVGSQIFQNILNNVRTELGQARQQLRGMTADVVYTDDMTMDRAEDIRRPTMRGEAANEAMIIRETIAPAIGPRLRNTLAEDRIVEDIPVPQDRTDGEVMALFVDGQNDDITSPRTWRQLCVATNNAETTARVRQIEVEIESLSQQLLAKAGELRVAERTMDPEGVSTESMRDFNNLVHHHTGVESAKINGSKATVLLKPIVTNSVRGNLHKLGMISFEFDLQKFVVNSVLDGLKIRNWTFGPKISVGARATNGADRVFSGQAGHVNSNGVPCLGSWLQPLADAAMAHSFEALVDNVIAFLKNPDPSDAWGAKILAFPIVTEGMAEGTAEGYAQ